MRFDKGLHCRIGDQAIQDEAILARVMKKVIKLMEARFQEDKKNTEVVEASMFFLVAYLTALRGNKIPMANFGAMRNLQNMTESGGYYMLIIATPFTSWTQNTIQGYYVDVLKTLKDSSTLSWLRVI